MFEAIGDVSDYTSFVLQPKWVMKVGYPRNRINRVHIDWRFQLRQYLLKQTGQADAAVYRTFLNEVDYSRDFMRTIRGEAPTYTWKPQEIQEIILEFQDGMLQKKHSFAPPPPQPSAEGGDKQQQQQQQQEQKDKTQ
jgi:hypothetical protein